MYKTTVDGKACVAKEKDKIESEGFEKEALFLKQVSSMNHFSTRFDNA